MTKEMAANYMSIRVCQAAIAWHIEVFGEHLSEKNKWGVDARDAVSLYLAKKYGWTIDHCHSLSFENLELVLCEELKAFGIPKHLAPVSNALHASLDALHKIAGR